MTPLFNGLQVGQKLLTSPQSPIPPATYSPIYDKLAVNGANPHLGAMIMTVNGPKLNDEPVRAIVWSDYV